MSLRRLLDGDRVTLVRRAAAAELDRYGNPAAAEPELVEVPGYLELGDVDELTRDRQTETADARVYLAAGTALEAVDAVEHHGRRYEVLGHPLEYRNPRTGQSSHLVARLRAVT